MLSVGTRKVIAIGASTGGVEALEQVLTKFPTTVPPIVLVIHMPPGFTKLFAARLNKSLKIAVKEAQQEDYLLPGQVLVAPAGKHMKIVNLNGKLAVDCFLGEKVHHVIPSVDVLFESVAKNLQKDAIGVLLTGMGADGARGLLTMRNNGAATIGQDKETSAIYGMPKVAKELGAVDYELPLDQIGNKILSLV
ncbi:MAG: CheB methylesterase domain-containing protein [Defluviitaleaceae bacterium]|nr:CheB methylesterase domain-containing protein [Defluviitaleaceae bacterium]